MAKTWTKRAFNPQRVLRELDRQYGPFETDQTPEELLHLLQSEGLLEEVQIGLSSVRIFLDRKRAAEGTDEQEEI